MKILYFALISVLCGASFARAQTVDQHFRVFDRNGAPATMDQIVTAIGENDAVFLGEQHDDAIGHAIQLEIFKRVVANYSPKRKVALSLEMFERDVQTVVNEYLKGLITEQHFLLSSRPWPNYKADYRPLFELAKERRLDVIAANAPRRYVNMVSRGGRASLAGLSKETGPWLAPLPYGEPSAVYAAKFKALMGPSAEAQMGIDNILASQSLWDATMADSVRRYLKKNKNALVIHLNGSFHTESRLGTVEHLLKYRSKTRVLVVTMRYEDDFKTFDKAKHSGLGDFVILTAPRPKGMAVLSAILGRMDLHSKSLRSLKCRLTLVRYNRLLNVSDTSFGHGSYLSTPMALRVDWLKPVEEQMVVVGDAYELYRPRLNQVIQGRTSNLAKAEGPLAFMKMSRDQLKANHTIMLIGEEELADGVKTWHLTVVPKIAALYKTADLWVDADGMPRQVRANLNNGDSTTVLLSNIQKNVTLKGEIFRLNYPASVKKIRSYPTCTGRCTALSAASAKITR